MRSLSYPITQIAQNAGKEGAVIVHEVLKNPDPRYGYDAALDEYKDLITAGIIDPTKVERCALENAISVAGMFLTTEAIIVDVPIDLSKK
jgi:chaperonin GroEL